MLLQYPINLVIEEINIIVNRRVTVEQVEWRLAHIFMESG